MPEPNVRLGTNWYFCSITALCARDWSAVAEASGLLCWIANSTTRRKETASCETAALETDNTTTSARRHDFIDSPDEKIRIRKYNKRESSDYGETRFNASCACWYSGASASE